MTHGASRGASNYLTEVSAMCPPILLPSVELSTFGVGQLGFQLVRLL